jgi:hypothetical protein
MERRASACWTFLEHPVLSTSKLWYPDVIEPNCHTLQKFLVYGRLDGQFPFTNSHVLWNQDILRRSVLGKACTGWRLPQCCI